MDMSMKGQERLGFPNKFFNGPASCKSSPFDSIQFCFKRGRMHHINCPFRVLWLWKVSQIFLNRLPLSQIRMGIDGNKLICLVRPIGYRRDFSGAARESPGHPSSQSPLDEMESEEQRGIRSSHIHSQDNECLWLKSTTPFIGLLKR